LIRAARDLIAEREDGNFSMPELAARAGLSLATPYNLFGSKAAILREVYRAETEGFRRTDKPAQRKPPVERVMATVAHTSALLRTIRSFIAACRGASAHSAPMRCAS